MVRKSLNVAPELDAELGERHKPYEDVLAMLLGTLFVALGVVIYAEAMLLVGGVAGVALLLQYVTGAEFWLVFFLINLPFYVLAAKRRGWLFTVRTRSLWCRCSRA